MGPTFWSPLVVSIRVRMFDLRNIGSGRSEGASRRTQINPIWRTWKFHGGVFFYWLCRTGFFAMRRRMMTQGLTSGFMGSPQEFFYNVWMFEECEPPIPVTILLGRSGFVDAVRSVEAAVRYDIQEITFLGGCLMWNNVSVLESNARGKLNSNINSPSDCRGNGNTILVGAPKTTRQFNSTAWQQCVSKMIISEASPKKVPISYRVRIEHVSW